jgi:asparagine synthase (glutamine-hydrolysing)
VNLAPDTIVSKVTRLRPGTYFQASINGLRTVQYWDMRYETDPRAGEDDLARGLEAVVEDAVAAHSRHEDFARVGAFLSGGTDSSTVVGMMDRLKRGPVQTFSIGFEEERFNELQYARIAASRFKTNHHEYRVTATDCLDSLPGMIRSFDEPFGNSSAIPTYFCAKLAAQHGVDTLLAGDGGDELFGGNERYRTDKIFEVYQNMPRPLRKGVIEPVLARLPMSNGVVGKARRYVRRSNFPQPHRFFSYNPLLENSPADIFDEGFLASLGGYSVLDIPSEWIYRPSIIGTGRHGII